MKKSIYLCALLLLAAVLSANTSQAKAHIVSHSVNDSCGMGSMFYMTSDSSTSPMSLEVSYGDGTTDTNTVTVGGGYGYSYPYHTYTSAGSFTIKEVLFSGSTRLDSVVFSYSYTPCSYLYGNIYLDNNSNCINDAGDSWLSTPISVEVDSAGVPVDTVTNYYGFWYMAHSYTATYTFKLLSAAPTGLVAACPSGHTITATAAPYWYHAGDFGFQCGTGTAFDVSLYTYHWKGTTRGGIEGLAQNTSCTSKSGTVTLTIDSKYTYGGSWPSGGTVSGNTVTWSYTGLAAGASQWYAVWGSASPALSIGDVVSSSYRITPVTGDADTTNNSGSYTDTVKGPWDPNEKSVTPQGNVKAGTRLTYSLAFENTGNAPAKNIHIQDTLSANLDANSLQVVASSAALNVIKLKDATTGRTVVKFDFANINLLDSTHHGQADGFVTFSINTKAGLATGTAIDNRAGIYFDYNKVVMTNTVENKIGIPASVGTLSNVPSISIYPNPVRNELNIKMSANEYNTVQIINTLGQVVLQQQLNSTETQINVKSLVPGTYYIMLKGSAGSKVQQMQKL